MLKFGEKIINQIYLGDKKIAKVFWGDKLVYQAGEPIFLDYVIFDGNSWIDTGIKYQTCTAEITVKYYEDNKRMLNGWSDQAGCYWGMYTDGRLELGNTYLNNTNLREKTTVNISLDTSTNTLTATVNGESISRSGTGSSRSYWIGATTSTSSAKVVGVVYGSKFWNVEGEVIKDLRPCIDTKGTVCFYDLVTKKYFYNQGTGTLTAGNKINFVDYIIFDGNSYIDTGIQYQTCTVKTETKFYQTGTRQLMGFSGSSSIHYWGCSTSGVLEPLTSVSGLDFNKIEIAYNKDDVDNKTLTLTANGKSVVKTGKIDTTKSYLIGCLDTSSYFAQCEVKYNKIYANDKLIQDLRPCVVAGEAGFYDMVTGKIFTNAGTGTLKASGRFVKSILFDGASYIDTGIKHQTCIVECDIRFEETGTRQLMGFGTGSGQYWGAGATGIFDYMNDTNALDRTLVVIDFNAEEFKYTIYADGKSRTSASGNALSSLTYRIGAGPTGVSSNAYWCTCEVWGNKFTNADGVIIQDLRPYVDDDGVACFKDLVTGSLFYNQGTGTLGYTE